MHKWVLDLPQDWTDDIGGATITIRRKESVTRTRDATGMEGAQPVTAFHGTSDTAAERIRREGFVMSTNRYDWLGDGTYFFQDVAEFPHSALNLAWAWARKEYPGRPAVIKATIDLVDCMDLLDHGWAARLRGVHNELTTRARRIGRELPKQAGGNRGLDRLLVNYVAGVLADAGRPVRSVRACFGEDERAAFPGSSLFELTHIQIAVRDAGVISEVQSAEEPPPSPVPWTR